MRLCLCGRGREPSSALLHLLLAVERGVLLLVVDRGGALGCRGARSCSCCHAGRGVRRCAAVALVVVLVVVLVAALVRCALCRLVVTPFVALVVGCSLHRALPWSALLLLLAVQCCHVLGVVVVSASFLRVRRLDCRLVCRLVLFLSVARRLRRLRRLHRLRRLSSSPSLGWSVSLLACLSSCHRLVGLFPTRIKQAGGSTVLNFVPFLQNLIG